MIKLQVYVTGTIAKCPFKADVRMWEVSVRGGSIVEHSWVFAVFHEHLLVIFPFSYFSLLCRTQAQGTQAQGTQAQGTQAQGTQAHGTQAHGTQAQGTQAQGTQAQGNFVEIRSTRLIHVANKN